MERHLAEAGCWCARISKTLDLARSKFSFHNSDFYLVSFLFSSVFSVSLWFKLIQGGWRG
jgi:hypothetical protein